MIKTKALRGESFVALHHDSDFFRPMVGLQANLSSMRIQEWKNAVIPSFNSHMRF
jgi:hypothetical protein